MVDEVARQVHVGRVAVRANVWHEVRVRGVGGSGAVDSDGIGPAADASASFVRRGSAILLALAVLGGCCGKVAAEIEKQQQQQATYVLVARGRRSPSAK